MAEAMPNRQSPRNGISGKNRSPGSSLNGNHGKASSMEQLLRPSAPEVRGEDALLFEEMNQLSEEDRSLLSALGSGLEAEGQGDQGAELEQVRAENATLRRALAELREQLEATSASEKARAEREKEYDTLLEEKSEVIRSLHLKMQDFQGQPSGKPVGLPNEGELQAICDDLERERNQLDVERRQMEQERAQLKEDEDALMKQMRDMEMTMSRERAELARQRNELHRLHNDVKHELELAARDATLRDRLVGLQRRHQDIGNRKGAPAAEPPQAAPTPTPPPLPVAPPKKESGLFRRLFGSGS